MKYLILSSMLLVGCSVEPAFQMKDQNQMAAEPSATPSPEVLPTQNITPVRMEGHMSGAFEIAVDGEVYVDTETYYTEQLTKLELQAVEAGYEGYAVLFDISVGSDFFKNTSIHAQSEGGFSDETLVDRHGRWSMNFAPEADSQSFEMRSVKRVSVVLTKEGESEVRWCHNLVGQATVDAASGLNAVKFTEFESRLTRYECEQKKAAGSIKIETTKETVKNFEKSEEPKAGVQQ